MTLRQDSISRLSKAYYLAFGVILTLIAFGSWRAHQLVQEGRGVAVEIARIAEMNRLAYEIATGMAVRNKGLLMEPNDSSKQIESEISSNLNRLHLGLSQFNSSAIVARANAAAPPSQKADFEEAAVMAAGIRARWNLHKEASSPTPETISATYRDFQSDINRLHVLLDRASTALVQYSDSNRTAIRETTISVSLVVALTLLLQALFVHRKLTRSLRQSIENLSAQRAEIKDQNTRLIALGADLERQNAELQEHQAELAQALQEQQISNELLTVASMRFQQLFHSTPVACFSCDLDGNVYEWNRASEGLFGYEAFRVFEQNAIDLLTTETSRDELQRLIQGAAETQASAMDEMEMQDQHGTLLRVQVSAVPVRGGQGQITGVIASCVDLTVIRQVQDQLRMLSVVAENSINGIMVTDPNENIVYCNPALEGMFGYTREQMTGKRPGDFLQGPETDPLSRQKLRHAIEARKHVVTEIVNYRQDGSPITIELFINPVFSDTGELLYFAAIETDITERKKMEAYLRLRDDQFSALMGAIQSGVMLYGSDGQLLIANSYAVNALGLQSGEHGYVLPQGWQLKSVDGRPLTDIWSEFGQLREQRLGETVVLERPDQPQMILSVDTVPIVDSQTGDRLGGLRTFTNITAAHTLQLQLESHLLETAEFNLQLELKQQELEALNTKLEALATTDGLTGLTNHRSFRESLEQELKRAPRSEKPFSLVLLDVDHFKAFNDTFGHQAGDEVLKGVAERLLSVARDSDLVARYGGEEFVLLLPKADADGAMVAVERFRKALDDHEWPYQHVTASFGVATYEPGTGPNELIEQADRALYASKRGGRNCATHYQDLQFWNANAA